MIARARAGDQEAWSDLFEECYPKILRVIRRRMSQAMRRHYDSTDIANEVMNSLALRFGDFDFDSVTDLRKFVLHAAQQKVVDRYRYERAGKRDSDRTQSFATGDGSTTWEPADDAPTPSQVVIESELRTQLLGNHSGPTLDVVKGKIEGSSNTEVAAETGLGLRTIQRIIKSLKDNWRQ